MTRQLDPSLTRKIAEPTATALQSQREKYPERFLSCAVAKKAWLDEACRVTVSEWVQPLGKVSDESTNTFLNSFLSS